MPEEKRPTEAVPPRFGSNDPPNSHISRDTPPVLQTVPPVAMATTVAPTGVSVTGASMSEGPLVQTAAPPSFPFSYDSSSDLVNANYAAARRNMAMQTSGSVEVFPPAASLAVAVTVGTPDIDVIEPVKAKRRTVVIRNKTQVIREAGVLIAVLDDALGYQPRDGSNLLPPELWHQLNLADPESFALISDFVEQLKKFNAFLESDRKKGSNAKIVAELQKVGLKVLKTYGNTVAVGAGLLTIGALCTLLQHVGLGEVVDNALIWKNSGH